MIRPDVGWNALLVASLAGIVAAGWYGFLMPAKPVIDDKADLSRIEGLISKAKEKTDAAQKEVVAKTWNLDQETLAATVLTNLTVLAERNKVQLASFRSEKPTTMADLNQAPFVAVVEGSFLDVTAFTSKLEQPDSKLAVEMLQITSSDTAPGRVIATLGLVGYTRPRGADVPSAKPSATVSISEAKEPNRKSRGPEVRTTKEVK